MSFKIGSFDSDSIEGFKAILDSWPVLPVELQLDELPAGDGSLYYASRMTETEWKFNLELTGSSLTDVLAKADAISAALNPKLRGGLEDFTPNPLEGWTWQGILGDTIEWERDKVLWFSEQGVSRLSGTLVVVTPNPHGYVISPAETLATAGTMSLPNTGNTQSYPTVEFRGVLNSAQYLSFGGVRIYGPLTSAQTLVADFENLEFFIKTTSSGAKVANIADRLENFNRLPISPGGRSFAVSVSGGTFTQAVGRVNSRRI
ncbi:minor tail protein [Microbacterium phage Pikmin]|uniref:Minor tail protein n=2 Tax=Pikminvirus pikmin TaxID=2560596 RepID=A0A2P1CKE5_9CAUD|nr:minor tail protein [Microbacterium phage Pikmin]AVJ51155.1 minor tail protein [Microbacterium phage Pikmin]AVJ51713.1 minor tail protein [Microbacterium phage Casey]